MLPKTNPGDATSDFLRAGGAGAEALGKLQRLQGPLDESSGADALSIVLDSVQLRYGGLFHYNSDGPTLSLLSHRGLSDVSLDALRTIRRGVSGVWDMPLHAVLQRRVYIVEKPRENPFVPPLLDGKDQAVLSNLAVIPLFAGSTVTGALLLVGTGVHSVRDVDIVNLREHTKLLGALLRRPDTRNVARLPRLLQPIAEIRPDLARERASLTARVSELEAQIETVRRSPAQPVASAEAERRLTEVTRDRDRLASELSLQEVTLRSLRSEQELYRQQSATEAERGHRLALDTTRMREELVAAREAALRLQQDRDQAEQSRSDAESRLAEAQQRLAEAHERSRLGESRGGEVAARLAGLEAERDDLRRALGGREKQLEEVREERQRLMDSLQTALGRYQETEAAITGERESSAEERASLQAEIEALQSEIAAVQGERDQLRAGLAGRGEVVQEIERETERFRTELSREIERRRAAEQTSASVIHDAAAVRGELERQQTARVAAETELAALRVDRERLSLDLETQRLELREAQERLGGEVARLRSELGQSKESSAAAAAESERVRAELLRARERAAELEKRATEGSSAERAVRDDNAALAKQLAEVRDGRDALGREREALVGRVGSLQENVAHLMRELEETRAVRSRGDEELTEARQEASERQAEAAELRTELRALESRTREEAEARTRGELTAQEAIEQARALATEVTELRADLERAQAFSSQLTADLDIRGRSEADLQGRVAGLERDVEERVQRLHAEVEQRGELERRLAKMEELLRGTSGQLAEKAREVDFLAMLRATLAKSEGARRQAAESLSRLEATVASDRRDAQAAREEAESARQEARDLGGRLEEVDQRLREAEEAAGEANQRAAMAASEQAAASETASQLAAELGRRSGVLAEATSRLESLEHELASFRGAAESTQQRSQGLEESTRAQALEIAELKRRAAALEEEKQGRVHALEIELAEARSRIEHGGLELAAAQGEQRRLVEALRAQEVERQKASQALVQASSKGAEAEAAAAERRAEAGRLAAEIDAMRRRAESLENDLRSVETEGSRWRALAEKLQQTIDERVKEMQSAPTSEIPAAGAERAPARALRAAPGAVKPLRLASAQLAPVASPGLALGSGPVVFLDDPGPALDSLTEACKQASFEVRVLAKGEAIDVVPALVAVNLLAPDRGGFEALQHCRSDGKLQGAPLTFYATRPGGTKGITFPTARCLVRPIEETQFTTSLGTLLGRGKRVTIVGEELDSVLRLNGWASARGCSVSSAGDLKQGGEILDIVKPDLIVFDFSRLGGESAALLVKVRRSPRLDSLPLLLVIAEGQKAQTATFFLKRLATLADEAPFEAATFEKRLREGT